MKRKRRIKKYKTLKEHRLLCVLNEVIKGFDNTLERLSLHTIEMKNIWENKTIFLKKNMRL